MFTPAEDLNSIPRNHMVAYNHLQLQLQGVQYSLLTAVTQAFTWYTYKQAGKTFIHVNKQTNRLERWLKD